MSVRELLKVAALPERTVSLCLRGDLVKRYETLERQLQEANDRNSDTFGGGDSPAIAAEMEALRAEMKESSAVFAFRALKRLRPITLIAEHPPREGNDSDKPLGYNQDTYYEALVRETCYEVRHGSDVLPADQMSDEEWTSLFDNISHKQFDNLVSAAFTLNNTDVNIPSSALGSLISQRNAESSKPPARGESARKGSRAGSRNGSPTTSTTAKAPSSGPSPG